MRTPSLVPVRARSGAPTASRGSRVGLTMVAALVLAAVFAAPAGAHQRPRDAIEFYAKAPHTPDKTQCAIYDGHAGLSEASCSSFAPREGKATVQADGSVALCRAPKGA